MWNEKKNRYFTNIHNIHTTIVWKIKNRNKLEPVTKLVQNILAIGSKYVWLVKAPHQFSVDADSFQKRILRIHYFHFARPYFHNVFFCLFVFKMNEYSRKKNDATIIIIAFPILIDSSSSSSSHWKCSNDDDEGSEV